MEMLELSCGTETSVMDAEIPFEQQVSLIEGAKLPSIFQDLLRENNNPEVYASLGVNTFGQYVASYISKVLADAIAFLVTFILVFAGVRIAIKFLGIINKIPLIGGANRIVGGVIGLLIGLVIVWVLFILVTLLYSTALGAACMQSIAENPILSKLYDGNLLMNAITKF